MIGTELGSNAIQATQQPGEPIPGHFIAIVETKFVASAPAQDHPLRRHALRCSDTKGRPVDECDRDRAPWIGAPKNELDSTNILGAAAPGADLVGGGRCVSQGWKAALY